MLNFVLLVKYKSSWSDHSSDFILELAAIPVSFLVFKFSNSNLKKWNQFTNVLSCWIETVTFIYRPVDLKKSTLIISTSQFLTPPVY